MTDWLSVDDPVAPKRAAQVIREGGLVILPTDTVYGVAADLWQPDAVAGLYAAKQRPPDKAIPVLLSDAAHMAQVAVEVSSNAMRLADLFWPGPLTIAVPRKPEIPEIVSSLPTIGLRIPDHDHARAVIRACGGALAVTSANLSGEPSPLIAQQAAESLGEHIALVLDGGPCPGGVASTVIGLSGDDIQILRTGPITEDQLRAALSS